MAEPRIVAILRAHGDWMHADDLCERYCADGAALATARNAITHAVGAGWIDRSGQHGNYRYRLSATAPSEVLDGRARSSYQRQRVTAPQDTQPAAEYVGPAFDRGPLLPSVGLACDPEVMPPEVGRIVDSLHRHFDALFLGVE